MAKKYRKKPVVIEAVQWTGSNLEEVKEFVGGSLLVGPLHGAVDWVEVYIKTLEGDMYVSYGGYIIKGVKGEFYPCKPDIFEATYEEATDGD